MNLLTQQRQFQQQLLNANANTNTETDAKLEGPLNLKHAERMSVYSNGYYLRIAEAMQSDFPMLLKWMGEAPFNALVRDYLRQYPTHDYTIREVGKNLPHYLAEQEECHPLLAELAHLEWKLTLALLAENKELLTLDDCLNFSTEQWLLFHFNLHPSVQLFRYNYPLIRFWTALTNGQNWGTDPADWKALSMTSCCVIWRDPNHQACVCELSQAEAQLFDLFHRQLNFTQICEKLVSELGQKSCSKLIETTLQCWIKQGFFLSFFAPPLNIL